MQLQPRPHFLGNIPSGVDGKRATLQVMGQLVRAFKVRPEVRNVAVELTHACAPKARACELRQLQHFVRDRIRYIGDVEGVETLQTPIETLRIEAGDCDDKAILVATLAASIGFVTIFWAMQDPSTGGWHVIAGAKLGRGYIPLETIFPNVEPGWFPPNARNIIPFHV